MSIIKDNSKLRYNFGIEDHELYGVKCFLQGAVYCWLKNRPEEGFSVRDLVGGVNFDWNGTPLYCLYEKHKNKGKNNPEAIEEAGKDAGWILKSTLHEDQRSFEKYDKGLTNGYKWVK